MRVSYKIVITVTTSLLMFSILYFFISKADKGSNATLMNKQDIKQVMDLESEVTKMEQFIESNLPNPNIFKEYEVVGEKGENSHDAKVFPLQMLYTGIQENNVDIFLSAFTIETINEYMGAAQSFQERANLLSQSIQSLSRDGLLKNISYQLDQLNEEVDNNGVLFFIYSDNRTIEVPFQLKAQKEEEHAHSKKDGGKKSFYQLSTPISHMIEIVESQKK
ncbi:MULTISPECIES: hypothetical protein [Bacillus]|uniref:hypothetical protein n=1 Tax=Bacillus TaxID=1386 RepID=UPI00273E0387|nr:hypothetical protein [Bacillus sp. MMSF_3328]